MQNTYFAFVLNPNPSIIKLKATDFDSADAESQTLRGQDVLWIFDAADLREFLTSGDKALNNWS